MSKEIVFKKLDQIRDLIFELDKILSLPFLEFNEKNINIRATERDFQLLVEQASDINSQIVLEQGSSTPDTYKESFRGVEKLGILDAETTEELMESAKLRNILIHEYDFDQDNFIFYKSVKKFMPTYKKYIGAIEKYYEKR